MASAGVRKQGSLTEPTIAPPVLAAPPSGSGEPIMGELAIGPLTTGRALPSLPALMLLRPPPALILDIRLLAVECQVSRSPPLGVAVPPAEGEGEPCGELRSTAGESAAVGDGAS